MKIPNVLSVIVGALLLAACAAPPAPTMVPTRAPVPTSVIGTAAPLPTGAGVTIKLAKGEGAIIKNVTNGDEFAFVNTGVTLRNGEQIDLRFFGMPRQGRCDDVECFLVPVYRAPGGKGPVEMFVVSLTSPAFTPEMFGLMVQRPTAENTVFVIARQGNWQVIGPPEEPLKLPPLGGQKV